MDLLGLAGDRKQQRIRLEESGGGGSGLKNVIPNLIILVVFAEEESSVQNLMDSNCIQYRVTGGGGGEGGGGALSYRVVSQESEQSNGTSVNTNSLGNVQVSKLCFSYISTFPPLPKGCACKPPQWSVLRDWKP